MRIHSFRIVGYRLFDDVTLDFLAARPGRQSTRAGVDEFQAGYTLDFLAGVNGTGKSTVLRLLAGTFAALSEGRPLPAPLEIIYSISDGNHLVRVKVTNLLGEEGAPRTVEERRLGSARFFVSDESEVTWRILEADGSPLATLPSRYLPTYVVAYTSGDEQAFLRSLEAPEAPGSLLDENAGSLALSLADAMELRKDELPGWLHAVAPAEPDEEGPSLHQRVLFVRSNRLAAVALCGLLASRQIAAQKLGQLVVGRDAEVLREVLDALGIEQLTGFSLRCRMDAELTHRAQRDIVETLSACADHVLVRGAERLLIFDLSRNDRHRPGQSPDDVGAERNVYCAYRGALQLFQQINALYEHTAYYNAPLEEINLFLQPRRLDGSQAMLHLFEWLSDGERSFLSRMALFALFHAVNVLVLLDEPEVHFNDVWKREIVATLDRIMSGQRSHAVVTTHSSITLTDIEGHHIQVLRREASGAVRVALGAQINTFGADPSDVIVHVFGSPHATGAHSVRSISRRIAAAESLDELRSLSEHIAPGYWRYRVELEIHQRQQTEQGPDSPGRRRR